MSTLPVKSMGTRIWAKPPGYGSHPAVGSLQMCLRMTQDSGCTRRKAGGSHADSRCGTEGSPGVGAGERGPGVGGWGGDMTASRSLALKDMRKGGNAGQVGHVEEGLVSRWESPPQSGSDELPAAAGQDRTCLRLQVRAEVEPDLGVSPSGGLRLQEAAMGTPGSSQDGTQESEIFQIRKVLRKVFV